MKLTEVVGAFLLFCGFGDPVFHVSTMHAAFGEVVATDAGSRFEEVPHEVEMFEGNVTPFIEWSQYFVRVRDLAARQRGEKIDRFEFTSQETESVFPLRDGLRIPAAVSDEAGSQLFGCSDVLEFGFKVVLSLPKAVC